MADQMNPHTIAALAFARLRTRPSFERHYPWLRNTVVCVETDLVSEVQERMLHLLPGGGEGSVACYFPSRQMFVFRPVGVATGAEPPDEPPGLRTLFTSDDVPHDQLTMGQAFATADLLSDRLKNLPTTKRPDRIGIESTTEIEKELALT